VEAGLGTLGLNLQLLTPEYGPRVVLTAVLASVDVECDRRIEQALCLGPSCARCLKVCPGDAVGHWSRDWEACDPHRSPHGFAQLSDHVTRIIAAPTPEAQKELVRSEDSFNLWQSILRGAGVITGCRKCADVCPVGADYQAMLADALDAIPDSTAAKENRAVRMEEDERADTLSFLERHGLSYVSVDSPLTRASNVLPRIAAATHPVAYVRFHGRNWKTWNIRGARTSAERFDHMYTAEELTEWVDPLGGLAKGAEEVYAMMNNNRADYAPRSARILRELLDEHGIAATGAVEPPETGQLQLGM